MKKTILTSDKPGVAAALRLPALEGRKPIAEGRFSLVFDSDTPGRVLKLTADAYVQKVYTANKNRLRWLPVCVKAYGEVGQMKVGGLDVPLYLFEQEKLEPVTAPEAVATRDRIIAAWSEVDSLMQAGEGAATPITCLAYVAGQLRGSDAEKLLRKLLTLAKRQDDGNLRLNLGRKNFLQRADGTLVCVDPFVDGRLQDELL